MKNENKDSAKRKKIEEKKEIRKYKHHKRFWKFIRVVAKPIIKMLFKFECEIAPAIKGPYLVVSNHTTDLDPAFLGISFPPQMYFVASEHVYRSGI
ncbi:MAG: 1-acyl-sn-glycerol-3-phosphate acyltransferase, partial [Spirochaetaceae bacterium]|nr:1-acyl-sn-glycerol-3-phosphate acyltransferase [Spirochaetaceae bacterium]